MFLISFISAKLPPGEFVSDLRLRIADKAGEISIQYT